MPRKSIDLLVATDPEWVSVILADFDAFLQDHANCERKASALAMSLVVKYPDRARATAPLIAIAQEELEHFRQVHEQMQRRHLTLIKDSQDPYVNQLLALMRHGRDARFLDRMLIASVIECRGAERFALIAAALEESGLRDLYRDLWKAEVKHAHQFVELVLGYFDPATVYARLHEIAEREADIVQHLEWRPALH